MPGFLWLLTVDNVLLAACLLTHGWLCGSCVMVTLMGLSSIRSAGRRVGGMEDPTAAAVIDPGQLWYIRGKAYDLTSFLGRHPGEGAHTTPECLSRGWQDTWGAST